MDDNPAIRMPERSDSRLQGGYGIVVAPPLPPSSWPGQGDGSCRRGTPALRLAQVSLSLRTTPTGPVGERHGVTAGYRDLVQCGSAFGVGPAGLRGPSYELPLLWSMSDTINFRVAPPSAGFNTLISIFTEPAAAYSGVW